MTLFLKEVRSISQGDIEDASIAFTDLLAGETISTISSIVQNGGSDLTLTNKVINSVAYVDAHTNRDIDINEAAQVRIDATAATTGVKNIIATVTTSGGRTLVRGTYLKVV